MSIEELSKKLQLWRKNKKTPTDRIPEEYWQDAVKLAKKSNKPSMVAAKLGINANDLKKRMGTPIKKRKYPKEIKFQELKLGKSESRIPVIELTTTHGLTLKVYQ